MGSFRTYDFAVGAVSFEEATPLVRGQLFLVGKKFDDARKLLESVHSERLPKREVPLLLVSQAWCYANLGELESAWCFVIRALAGVSDKDDRDNLAYVYGRAAQVAQICEKAQQAAEYCAIAHDHLAAHRRSQAETFTQLMRAVDAVDNIPKKEGPT